MKPRKIEESCPRLNIRGNRISPLILIKHGGEIVFGKTCGDKDALVASFTEPDDTLLWAWAGEHSTDVFKLSKADLDKHY